MELARVVSVERTGVGFFAHFSVPPDAPRTSRPDITSGDATLVFDTMPDAGCLLFVRDGRLDQLEVYSFGHAWDAAAVLVEVRDSVPILRQPDGTSTPSRRGTP